jgi:hypothetical protein
MTSKNRWKRWRLRFTLRGFFVVVTLLAIIAAWVFDAGNRHYAAYTTLKAIKGVEVHARPVSWMRWLYPDYAEAHYPFLRVYQVDVDAEAFSREELPYHLKRMNGIGTLHFSARDGKKFDIDACSKLWENVVVDKLHIASVTFNPSSYTKPLLASELAVYNSDRIEHFVPTIIASKSLKKVILGKYLQDDFLQELSKIPNIAEIHLNDAFEWNNGSILSDRCLEFCSACRNLKVLRIAGANGAALTDSGVEHMAKLNGLEELELPARYLTSKSVDTPWRMPYLKSLRLYDLPEDSSLVREIHKLGHLEELSVAAELTPEVVNQLHLIPKLRTLTADRVPLKSMIDYALKSPRFEFFQPSRGNKFDRNFFLALACNGVSLDQDEFYTNNFSEVAGCLKYPANLNCYRAEIKEGFTDADLKQLAQSPELEQLWLESETISDQGLSHLSSAKSLGSLEIRSRTHL